MFCTEVPAGLCDRYTGILDCKYIEIKNKKSIKKALIMNNFALKTTEPHLIYMRSRVGKTFFDYKYVL